VPGYGDEDAVSLPADAVYVQAVSWGAPPEELEAIRDELLDAKQRLESPAASVWAFEVVALWAAREAAKASGKAPPRLGPKPPPRPPLAILCRIPVASKGGRKGFRCGLHLGHYGDHEPQRGQ
jgi:hypothetical protein